MPDDKRKKSTSGYISLSEAAANSPYSRGYISILVHRKKLRAVKIGRNWFTKKEWLDEYISKHNDLIRPVLTPLQVQGHQEQTDASRALEMRKMEKEEKLGLEKIKMQLELEKIRSQKEIELKKLEYSRGTDAEQYAEQTQKDESFASVSRGTHEVGVSRQFSDQEILARIEEQQEAEKWSLQNQFQGALEKIQEQNKVLQSNLAQQQDEKKRLAKKLQVEKESLVKKLEESLKQKEVQFQKALDKIKVAERTRNLPAKVFAKQNLGGQTQNRRRNVSLSHLPQFKFSFPRIRLPKIKFPKLKPGNSLVKLGNSLVKPRFALVMALVFLLVVAGVGQVKGYWDARLVGDLLSNGVDEVGSRLVEISQSTKRGVQDFGLVASAVFKPTLHQIYSGAGQFKNEAIEQWDNLSQPLLIFGSDVAKVGRTVGQAAPETQTGQAISYGIHFVGLKLSNGAQYTQTSLVDFAETVKFEVQQKILETKTYLVGSARDISAGIADVGLRIKETMIKVVSAGLSLTEITPVRVKTRVLNSARDISLRLKSGLQRVAGLIPALPQQLKQLSNLTFKHFNNLREFVTRPFRKVVEVVEKPPLEPDTQDLEFSIQYLESEQEILQEELAKLKEELVDKEIVRKEITQRITQQVTEVKVVEVPKDKITEITREKVIQVVKLADYSKLEQEIQDLRDQIVQEEQELAALSSRISQISDSSGYISSPRQYQEQGDLTFSTIGTGSILLAAAQAVYLQGDKIILDANAPANQGTPSIELRDQTNLAAGLNQTTSDQVSFTGNVDAQAGLDVSGGSLTVGGTNFTVDTSGNVTSAGDITANNITISDVTVTGDIDITGNLSVAATTTLARATIQNWLDFTPISQPSTLTGRQYYDTSQDKMFFYDGSSWRDMSVWEVASGYIYPFNVGTSLQIADTSGNMTLPGSLDVSGNITAPQLSSAATLTLQSSGSSNIILNSAGTIELQDAVNITSGNLNLKGNILYGSSADAGTLVLEGSSFDDGDDTYILLNPDGGNVGIATTTPSALLHVVQAGSSDALRVDDSAGDTTPFVIKADGKVGIGTASPSEKLHVVGDITWTGDILPINANQAIGSAGIRMYNGWFENLDITNMTVASSSISGTVSQAFTINSDNTSLDAEDSYLVFERGTTTPNALITWDSSDDRFDFNFPLYVDSSSDNYFGGNVGIATTSPSVALAIGTTDGVKLPAGTTAQRPTGIAGMIRFSTTANIFEGYNGSAWAGLGGLIDLDQNTYIKPEMSPGSNEDTLYFYTAGSEEARITSDGKFGLGTTTPASLLTVGSTGGFQVDSSGNITMAGDITLTAGGTIQSTGNNNITLDAGSGTVYIGDGTGKLDAGTVDPKYNIDGISYATYMASMAGGVKEEVTGVVRLQQSSNPSLYIYIIDFNSLEEGSDLWLFGKVVDWGDGMENLVALLASEESGKVSYKKDSANNRLIIYGDGPNEVSYRLTAPRFDYEKWPNVVGEEDQGRGFVVPQSQVTDSDDTLEIDLESLAASLNNVSEEPSTLGDLNTDGSYGQADLSSLLESEGLFGGFVQAIKQTMESFGLWVENGIARVKEIVADKLIVKKAEIEEAQIENLTARVNKMEFVDQATGEVYCTWIENEEWIKELGDCQNATTTDAILLDDEDNATTTPAIQDYATTTPTTSEFQ